MTAPASGPPPALEPAPTIKMHHALHSGSAVVLLQQLWELRAVTKLLDGAENELFTATMEPCLAYADSMKHTVDKVLAATEMFAAHHLYADR